MKIFVSHSTNYNFEEELYIPLQNSALNQQHEFVFPHENGQEMNTKDVIRDADLVVAEVSNPGTGQGIELGWASASYVSIVCFYKPGTQISDSIKYVTENIFEYNSIEEMVKKIEEVSGTI